MSDTVSVRSRTQETIDDPSATRLNVLVIDADREHALAVQKILIREDSRLVHTTRVDAGIKCLNEGRFDLVMLDFMLPGTRPLESLVGLTSSHPEVPVIVVTRLDDQEVASMAVQGGATDYLIKDDLENDTLIRSMRYAVERHRRQRAEEEVLAVQEKERRRLSRELHDGVIQTISAMRLQMQVLARELGQRDAAAAKAVSKLAQDTQTVPRPPGRRRRPRATRCPAGRADCRMRSATTPRTGWP